MQDHPTPNEILTSVASFLRNTVVVQSEPHTSFLARVAANAVDLVRRQIELGSIGEAAETPRLRALLGHQDSLDALNTKLADALAAGRIGLDTPGVASHLRATTLEKLAVDQPAYSGYRAAIAAFSDRVTKDD